MSRFVFSFAGLGLLWVGLQGALQYSQRPEYQDELRARYGVSEEEKAKRAVERNAAVAKIFEGAGVPYQLDGVWHYPKGVDGENSSSAGDTQGK